MTIRSAPKTERGLSDPRLAIAPPGAGSVATKPAHLGGVHMVLFDLVCGEPGPLTARQIERRMKLSEAEISEVIDELCQVRLLRRLSTVIESFTGPALPFS